MTVVEVEVISNEIIKPSSPTPDHLPHYQLSFLDQISPKVYNPLVFFYALNGDHHDQDDHRLFDSIITISNHLKKSLSEVLTLFYPLAGRVKDNLFVECNDKGVPYFEAKVKGQSLSDALKSPNASDLNKFLPFKLDEVEEFALGVQLNVFECGGIAIGVCTSHQLADALSTLMFFKTWAAMARGEADNVVQPEFVSATLFPPRNLGGFDPNLGITRKNIISKRFLFKASEIAALRDKYDEFESTSPSGNQFRRPSRVEALSTFIWSRFVAATNSDDERFYTVLQAVNLRPRFDPPLQDHHFGNFYRVAIIVPSSSTVREEYGHGLMRKVREEIRKIDKDFVKKLQEGNDEHFDFLKDLSNGVFRGEVVTFAFTSLCRFPVYEADFGWGKPTWFGSPALNFHNVTALFDTKMGDGIEAYISLKEEDMAKLEADKEFQAFVSPLIGS